MREVAQEVRHLWQESQDLSLSTGIHIAVEGESQVHNTVL